MVELLGQSSQGHEMCCDDLELMGMKPGWVKLGIRSTSVKVVLEPKTNIG